MKTSTEKLNSDDTMPTPIETNTVKSTINIPKDMRAGLEAIKNATGKSVQDQVLEAVETYLYANIDIIRSESERSTNLVKRFSKEE